jgi:hypothetical protein
LSLQNRSRALALGFYAAVLGSLLLYVAQWYTPIGAGDALKIVSAGPLAVALLR